jgi:ABC-type antimicrobial peptide transport system permease subunit
VLDLVRAIDPYIQVTEPKLLTEEDQQFARARFLTSLLAGFAVFATLLALLGIYGVTAYAVQQRAREVAIRMAVGATGGAVHWLFLRDSGVMLASGIGFGLIGTIAGTRVIASQIHVQPFDALTLGAASAILLAGALAALWRPVHRGANANLRTVLGEE